MRVVNRNPLAFSMPKFLVILFWLVAISFFTPNRGIADESSWRFRNTLQTYAQTYSGDSDWSSVLNAGYYLSADYLDSGNLGFGYTSTLTKFGNNVDDSGELLYLSAQKHFFPDSLPGKLSLRGAIWQGEDRIKFRDSSTNSNSSGSASNSGTRSSLKYLQNRPIRLDSGSIAETTDISAYYAELAFLNYRKSFYADAGYAHSDYDNSSKTKVDQLTTSLGFGWNQSYDWLQLRIYLIETEQQLASFNEDRFESVELKYTQWYSDEPPSSIEFVRLTALFGERILAVDPDTAAIYSIADTQNASLAASIQWKLSAQSKVLTSIQYDRYQDDLLTEYDSVLFYINFQFQTY